MKDPPLGSHRHRDARGDAGEVLRDVGAGSRARAGDEGRTHAVCRTKRRWYFVC